MSTDPRLALLAASELTRDPRGRRAARAAVELGYRVVGICPRTAADPVPLEDVELVRVAGERLAPSLNRLGLGGMGRHDRPLVRELRGLFRLLRLARTTLLLVRAAKRAGPFDVVHANEIDTLPAGWLIGRRRSTRLVYDAHEIYGSSEPDPPRLYRATAAWLEGVLARRCDAVVTVSDAIADELGRRLRLPRGASVALNCPDVVPRVESASLDGTLRAIYQGAMGPGRPLEDLLVAAEAVNRATISIRVANAATDVLRAEIGRRGLDERVSVLEPVSPLELVRSLAGFHVGLIFNRPVSRNDELVFPNKLFEYMMAGLAVVVPALPTLGTFVAEHGIGVTFPVGNAKAMGETLEALADDADTLAAMRRRARSLALERFNAESQAKVLGGLWRPSA